MRWSRLYPALWQAEFGEEFDAMLSQTSVGPKQAFDILRHATALRAVSAGPSALVLLTWLVIAWFNLNAKEVQWPAGLLLVFSAIASFLRPRRWFFFPCLFASSIPISSLYIYQIPGVKHEPLYHTVVALIPAMVGSLLGLAIHALGSPRDDGVAT